MGTIPANLAFPKSPLSIHTQTGKTLPFTVELATTYEQRKFGLMYRTSLDNDKGMLFLFEREEPAAMWMEKTFIPLDMVFLDKQGMIFHIVTHTVPESRDIIEPPRPAFAVLELAAGVVDKQGIAVGDKVIHKQFK